MVFGGSVWYGYNNSTYHIVIYTTDFEENYGCVEDHVLHICGEKDPGQMWLNTLVILATWKVKAYLENRINYKTAWVI